MMARPHERSIVSRSRPKRRGRPKMPSRMRVVTDSGMRTHGPVAHAYAYVPPRRPVSIGESRGLFLREGSGGVARGRDTTHAAYRRRPQPRGGVASVPRVGELSV